MFAELTLETAKAANVEIVTDAFPFRANGRAMTLASYTGFIRTVARADEHRLLGLQGVGARVPNSRRRSALGARLEDIAGPIFARPTLSEGMLEARRYIKVCFAPMHGPTSRDWCCG